MKIISKNFDFFSHSVTKAGKEKCGDSFTVQEFEEEGLLLLAVADGVSSCPCDWLASKTACETVVSVFKNANGNIAARMKFAAEQANSAIKKVEDSCKGMLTSLTFVIWEIGTDEIYILNVGDSRLYIGRETDLKQKTKDDTVNVLIKRNGEVLLNAGMPVFQRGVTRSLGQNDPLEFDVQKCDFTSKDLLVLVSDGICKNEAFTSEFRDIFSVGSYAEKLKQLVQKNSEKNKDDATLVILWRTEQEKDSRSLYEECIKQDIDFRESDISGKSVIDFLQEDLIRELSENANEEVKKLFNYALKYRLKFSRNFLSDFLSMAIKQGTDRDLVFRVRKLIRTSENS